MEDDATAGHGAATRRSGFLSPELRSRIVSGLVLAAIAAALAWAGVLAFAAFVLVVALLMSWEWARVVRATDFDVTFAVHAATSALAVALAASGLAALGLAAVVIGTIICLPLQFGEHPALSALGVAFTGVPSVALLWLRGDEPWGFMAILFLFVVVIATDTAAYACGRLLGGPKLWPRVSPNKTWAGLLGGLTAGVAMGAAFHLLTGSVPLALAITGGVLAGVAQAGDLAESALKRMFGVKDASDLIPGHGGFLDRGDGIVAAAIAAGLMALFIDPGSPAAALIGRF